jgi:hypothetical protein
MHSIRSSAIKARRCRSRYPSNSSASKAYTSQFAQAPPVRGKFNLHNLFKPNESMVKKTSGKKNNRINSQQNHILIRCFKTQLYLLLRCLFFFLLVRLLCHFSFFFYSFCFVFFANFFSDTESIHFIFLEGVAGTAKKDILYRLGSVCTFTRFFTRFKCRIAVLLLCTFFMLL